MDTTEQIKGYLLEKLDMDLVGVASADALAGEPEGHRPTDLLPGAKSVLVFGRAIADGAIAGAIRHLEDGVTAAQSAYAAYGSELAPNILLIGDSFRLACYLEDEYGAVAMPCTFNTLQSMVWKVAPGNYFADPYGQGMPLDIFKAACAAGLGELGWSRRLLTPEYGPRQMLSAVVTTLDLRPDAPYSGEKLCDPEKCGVCARVCPTHAISAPGEGGERVSVGQQCFSVCKMNANACTVASAGFRAEFSGRVPCPDLVMTDAPTDAELREAYAKKPINSLSLDHYPRYFCERCLVYCPAGKWKERFAEVSKFEG